MARWDSWFDLDTLSFSTVSLVTKFEWSKSDVSILLGWPSLALAITSTAFLCAGQPYKPVVLFKPWLPKASWKLRLKVHLYVLTCNSQLLEVWFNNGFLLSPGSYQWFLCPCCKCTLAPGWPALLPIFEQASSCWPSSGCVGRDGRRPCSRFFCQLCPRWACPTIPCNGWKLTGMIAAVHVIDVYLDDKHEKERNHIRQLAGSKDPSSTEVLRGYVREAMR